ncbi:hypothetical protein Ping_2977 [Psychromonas ingrahamii 37]|uniref:GmrSD restriction endonucleases N-terminal domain-containing protein n=1 Tax=Psychromonas ingrahamii (strain DSM 17664 / CCUG 51855 / 37) TaxID=357804 RepID=A1SYW4_PSYIN|nr:DUF262 domain-containing protein [Psychromonas ingrahamii]ABM04679.1 hypothetical protein Ping_2977 [Psychromonas ingrahamii 37]
MSIRLKRKSNTVTISSLNEWRTLDKLNMTPRYQRKSVWGTEQQSLLIDSILKNIPVPPVFLRESIDKKGITTFEVIDGKQRLTSIFKFIDNQLSTADDDNDALHVPELAGLKISDLEEDEFEDILSDFWGYPIPVEYVYTKDNNAVEKIFDRLNRSGEKLNGQELRNAKFYDSKLINIAYKFAQSIHWKKELLITNKNRMEDIELISEFIFLLIEGEELASSPKVLDELYKKYANSTDINWDEIESKMQDVSNFFQEMKIDFNEYNVSGVSHLYGLWAFSYHCVSNQIQAAKVKDKLHAFYAAYKESNFKEDNPLTTYKSSMMNATKGKGQRKKRKHALIEYCLSEKIG